MSSFQIDPAFHRLALEIGQQMAASLYERMQSAEPVLAPEYLSPQQVSQLTGYATKTLEAMRARRIGPPFIKVGQAGPSAIRYRLQDVRAWLDAQREETTNA
ncbi:MAG TPA: helix-turn-helix domain-containing protein [Geminicoccaceae bacterium]|nr:helix-turn-helix domain-containing protein [Geminicoccus sp.]HMU50244.1 helix-turn-helix domain-containing protein [Geminicoccaceae bacterium]